VSNESVFLWGAVGGALAAAFTFLELLRGSFFWSWSRAIAVLALLAVNAFLGGIAALVVIGSSSSIRASVVVFVGFASVAVVRSAGASLVSWTSPGADVHRSTRDDAVPPLSVDEERVRPRIVPRIVGTIRWFTAPRVSATAAVGMALIALVALLTR
jgi:hypothetical protein